MNGTWIIIYLGWCKVADWVSESGCLEGKGVIKYLVFLSGISIGRWSGIGGSSRDIGIRRRSKELLSVQICSCSTVKIETLEAKIIDTEALSAWLSCWLHSDVVVVVVAVD